MDRNVEETLAILAGRNLFGDDTGQKRLSQLMQMVITLRQAITLLTRDFHQWNPAGRAKEEEAFAQIVIATLSGNEAFIDPEVKRSSVFGKFEVRHLGYHDPAQMWSFYDQHIGTTSYVVLTEGVSIVEHGSAFVTHAIRTYESNAHRWTLETNSKLAHHASQLLFGAFWVIAKSPNAAKLETRLMVDPGMFGNAYVNLRTALLIHKNNR